MALSYVTLEIRRLYHGPLLTSGGTGGAEQYTYSIAWLAFGVALLGIGILVNSQRARLASAVVIALTILKAFLIDMSTPRQGSTERCRSCAWAWCWWRSAGCTSASCSESRCRRTRRRQPPPELRHNGFRARPSPIMPRSVWST